MTHTTASELQAALHYFGQPAPEPGGFMQSLVQTIVKADLDNVARLAEAFPAATVAVRFIQTDPDGVAVVQAALEHAKGLASDLQPGMASALAFLGGRARMTTPEPPHAA